MNINELGQACQRDFDKEELLKECIAIAQRHLGPKCPEVYGRDGYCDNCPCDDDNNPYCPSDQKDWTE